MLGMEGLKLLFWAVTYSAYNALVNPSRRWEVECDFCEEVKRANSFNMALLKESLHVHFEDDHPDGPEDVDGDWATFGEDPEMVVE